MINLQELLEKLRPEMVGISRRARYQDGWLDVDESATYASATSITLAVDVQDMFPTGCRVRLKQSAGTWKYFTVVSSSVDVSDILTLNLLGGSDYSVANEAISRMQVSYMSGAQPGWPGWFNYSPTLTGWSVTPPTYIYRFAPIGRKITLIIAQQANGTSNATSVAGSLPVAAASVSGSNLTWLSTGLGVDNGVTLTIPIRVDIVSGNTLFGCYTNMASGAWTASGNKRVYFQIDYEF